MTTQEPTHPPSQAGLGQLLLQLLKLPFVGTRGAADADAPRDAIGN